MGAPLRRSHQIRVVDCWHVHTSIYGEREDWKSKIGSPELGAFASSIFIERGSRKKVYMAKSQWAHRDQHCVDENTAESIPCTHKPFRYVSVVY